MAGNYGTKMLHMGQNLSNETLKKLQYLNALKRAPQGTLAFRFYLLLLYSIYTLCKTFQKLVFLEKDAIYKKHIKTGLMNDLLAGRKRVK